MNDEKRGTQKNSNNKAGDIYIYTYTLIKNVLVGGFQHCSFQFHDWDDDPSDYMSI